MRYSLQGRGCSIRFSRRLPVLGGSIGWRIRLWGHRVGLVSTSTMVNGYVESVN
jgi:hypothetical protein